MKIVLFDIDGTLLRSGGAGRRAMEVALEEAFGTRGASGYRYDGKTDRQIVREAMRMEGIDDARIEAGMEGVFARYLERLADEVQRPDTDAGVLPGIPALLDAVEAREDCVLALLTGNIVEGAHVKLRAAGIDPDRFVLGAFGTDHEERPGLPPIVQARAAAHLGRPVPGESLVIIGDTPADIHCGRGVGARAIAVATGSYSVDELASHAPAAVFLDLADTAAVVAAIAS
ncbi:MAG: haloacid dehalogenase-like hydrolase [Gemmatimonadaceae bacterium]|nr:haloacid dehalogenase-like hydrolase [Gemmatimonadaceae bacterium]